MHLFLVGQNDKDQKVKVSCYHCGEDCDQSDIIKFENHDFCCNGCKTVFQLFDDNDLQNYYALAEKPGITLKRQDNKTSLHF